MRKLNWFKIETIPRCNYFMLVPILEKYGTYVAQRGGGPYFNDVMWLIKNGTATLCYLRNNFTKGINFLLNKTITNPEWVLNLNKEIINQTKPYFSFAKKLKNKNFSKLSDKQLVNIFNKMIKHQYKSHISGQITTWLIDADRQLFSKYLIELLKNKIKNNLSEIFSVLTTPEKPSFTELETVESLKLAKLIKKNKRATEMFLKNDIEYIKNNISKLERNLQLKIKKHYKKYLWLHYNYEGPILELEYFLTIWKGLLKQNNIKKLLKESKIKFSAIQKKRMRFINQLKLNQKEIKLFNLAKDIVWLKGWRKDCMYFGAHVLDNIAKEIADRLGLSLKQVRYFCYWEVKDAVLKNKYNINKLNERYGNSAIYTDSVNRPEVYTEKTLKKFLKKCNFIEEKNQKINELTGVCACPGKAKGRVTVVETVDDIKKMKKGNIMLSETTYPALVPAMKLAAAIVTNVGGLTCHAAIISRELKIPCIVGTKIATRVLKDGDFVAVDAKKGFIKKYVN